jgi:hypothetical protein
MGQRRQRFVAPPNWPAPPPGWAPVPGWQPDPSWPPPPADHEFWQPEPRRIGRAIRIGSLVVGAPLLLLVACGAVLEVVGDPFYGPNACNDFDGNSYVDDHVVDLFPDNTLRAYTDTGPDCDDRRTGSVAAAWGANVHPAAIVDLLSSEGWARTDPPGGPPQWYMAGEPAGDPTGVCVGTGPRSGWHSPGKKEYPWAGCSDPASTQIVMEASRGMRVFVARLNSIGITVDVAHKWDDDGVREIRAGRLEESDE